MRSTWKFRIINQCARVNDVTGDIMLCRENRVSLFTLNGALLLDQVVCDRADDRITSCAFYEGANNEWLEKDLIFTGHKRGVVKVMDLISIMVVQLTGR